MRERKLVALLELCLFFPVAVSVLCLFLMVPLVGLLSVIVVLQGHIGDLKRSL